MAYSARSGLEDQAFDVRAAAGLAIGVLVLHIITNFITPYEFHRDEFLYFAMGEHLRLWRMDFPPFIAIVARFSHALLGNSIPGMRLAPAFSHAALVACGCWATWAFGGRRSAQMLAGLAIATSPFFVRPGALFQPVTFDQLWWTLALVSLIVRIRDNDPKHWIGLGIFLGLGALTKFSIAFLAVGLLVAVFATGLRRDLLTRWPWLGLVAAVVIGHPSVAGQVALGWPVRTQMNDLQASQLSRVGPLDFLAGQLHGGPAILIVVIGLLWMFFPRMFLNAGAALESATTSAGSRAHLYVGRAPAPDWRPIGIATVTAFVVVLLLHGKAYYIGPIYPVLIAAGAVGFERIGERIASKRPTKVLALMAATVAMYGLATLPFGLPLLEPNEMTSYSEALGPKGGNRTNTGEQLALPQDYADMTGWSAMVDTVARVWRSLPPSDTAGALLIATNYGRAGALDFLGRAHGLPPAIAPVGSYWFFGPGDRRGAVAVVVANDGDELHKLFADVTEAAEVRNSWGVPEEQIVRVFVCRQPLHSLAEVWPRFAGQN